MASESSLENSSLPLHSIFSALKIWEQQKLLEAHSIFQFLNLVLICTQININYIGCIQFYMIRSQILDYWTSENLWNSTPWETACQLCCDTIVISMFNLRLQWNSTMLTVCIGLWHIRIQHLRKVWRSSLDDVTEWFHLLLKLIVHITNRNGKVSFLIDNLENNSPRY